MRPILRSSGGGVAFAFACAALAQVEVVPAPQPAPAPVVAPAPAAPPGFSFQIPGVPGGATLSVPVPGLPGAAPVAAQPAAAPVATQPGAIAPAPAPQPAAIAVPIPGIPGGATLAVPIPGQPAPAAVAPGVAQPAAKPGVAPAPAPAAVVAQPPAPPKPSIAELSFVIDANVNPDATGRPSPVVVRIYELKSLAAFNRADFFTLYEKDREQLGADLVNRDEMPLLPGGKPQAITTLRSDTRYLGVIVAFRDIERAQWRASTPIFVNQTTRMEIKLDRNEVAIRLQ